MMIQSRHADRRRMGLAFDGIGRDAKWALGAIAILTAISIALMGVAVLLLRAFHPSLKGWPLELKDTPLGLYLLASVTCAPLVEEFVFRSLMIPGLEVSYSRRGVVVTGALFFYALHLAYGQPWWMAHYLVAGAILTWVFLQRRKLWICVVLHAGGNLLVISDDLLIRHAPGFVRKLLGSLPG